MVNVFGNMINNLKNEEFVKNVAKTLPTQPELTPEFLNKYRDYQQKSTKNQKKKSRVMQPI
ncbi:hypothetical protein H9635_07705 [Solibacillus sp. A46]|uniref:Uncharacterized protein n=1 Tax=Solibacillus faecavium TaxID=2762221 RepID=A0ABR8XXK1_9BACL|nr:hypothetical protein [Solibacillus faecavium]MBD8036623.1 hypothetical protein [Solibacillus faecavium]